MKNQRFEIRNEEYSIQEMDDGVHRRDTTHYIGFRIFKNSQYWSVVDIGIPDPLKETWLKGKDAAQFLRSAAPHVIKNGILKDEIRKLDDELRRLEYVFVFERKPDTENRKFLAVSADPESTINDLITEEKNLAKPRIGF